MQLIKDAYAVLTWNMSGERYCRLLGYALYACLSKAALLGLIQGEF